MIQKDKGAWAWVPVLYFTQGIPYVLVVTVSVIMYKKLGISNSDIGLYTSWLYLPWVLKPLWSPFVDLNGTKRKWFLYMQLIISLAILGVGLTVPTTIFFTTTLACFWMAAFASATNDIASDGYYMLGLTEKKQAFFVGMRSTFYRLAMITGQGLIVILAGFLENYYGDNTKAWSVTMIAAAILMLALTIANFFVTPKYETSEAIVQVKPEGFLDVFISFFKKPNIGIALAFILSYRLGESQLVKMAAPFLLDKTSAGGLEYSTEAVGTIYGTVGVIMLSLGGILGGILISKDGLKKWMLPMVLSLNLPNAMYAFLALDKNYQYSGGSGNSRIGTIWLWLWFCRLSDLPNLYCRGNFKNFTLRHSNGIYGLGNDAARNGQVAIFRSGLDMEAFSFGWSLLHYPPFSF